MAPEKNARQAIKCCMVRYVIGYNLRQPCWAVPNTNSEIPNAMKRLLISATAYALGLLFLAGCTTSRPTISERTFFREIDAVNQSLDSLGFQLSGTYSDMLNDVYVSSAFVDSEDGPELKNDYYWYDTYRFTDSIGNTISYQIKYKNKGSQDARGVYYVSNVSLVGCDCSNAKDYKAVCGPSGATNRLNLIENDQVSTFRNNTGTVFAVLVGVLAVLLGLSLI